MTEKRHIDELDYELNGEEKAKSLKFTPLTVNEVEEIIRNGDYRKLTEIIKNGRMKNISHHSSIESYTDQIPIQSLLTIACTARSIDCLKVLLENCADASRISDSNCDNDNIDMVKLLAKSGFSITTSLLLKLFTSAEAVSSTELVTLLIKYVNDIDYNSFLNVLMSNACHLGNLNIVKSLLDRGIHYFFPQGEVKRCPQWESSPLVIATIAGQLDIVKHFLSLNKDNNELITKDLLLKAFIQGASNGHTDIVQLLILEYGVATDIDTRHQALREAVWNGKLEVTKYLFTQGVDVNYRTLSGRSLLNLACSQGLPDMTRFLLSCGADINMIDGCGECPLSEALNYNHLHIVEVLFEQGVDPNRYLTSGYTVLIKYIRLERTKQNLAAITLLLQLGVNPDIAYATTGQTPLMTAALMQRMEYVKLLLEHGADVMQVDNTGRAVLDMLGTLPFTVATKITNLCSQYIDCKHILK